MKHSVRIELGTWSGNREPSHRVQLRISDDASGETIVHVDLTPEQAWLLINGTGLRAESTMTDHPDRIGRKIVVRQVNVPRDVIGSVYDRAKAHELALAHGESQAAPGEQVEARATNSGWKVLLRSWPEEV